ncbi:spore germination protein [Paenibacillus hamazuiensis]|uniref:spore germination protein n=1 Tax=Paenibacillus hamazuiensis TaxID=2936508 RepID=UPI00200C6F27|nr:spore germination protein [Paenibacillus hamazuiensis]
MPIKKMIASRKTKMPMFEDPDAAAEGAAKPLSGSLADNEAWLKHTFSNCSDLTVRKLHLRHSVPGIVVYFKELVDARQLDEELLEPLMRQRPERGDNDISFMEQIKSDLVPVALTQIIDNKKDAVARIIKGEVVLIADNSAQALAINVKSTMHRALSEPSTESVIRGPKIGFIENIGINQALLRRNIRTPRLKMEQMLVGKVSQTEVALAYMEGAASPAVIAEVKKRMSQIELDTILESAFIEEIIRDAAYSPFPVIHVTERPDSAAASLLEGRVVILVDGSPVSMIVPVNIWHAFQTVEDYYTNYIFATFLRWLRYFFAFISLTLPSFYVAVSEFNPELIPTTLAMTLAAAREPVPFPTLIEILMMEIAFEAIREAGIRLPRPVGQTISIVGVLVIGQAAVQAGIVSAPIVIIVSLTGIASFLIPNYNMSQAIRLMRFPLMLCAGIFGLYGVGAGLIALLIHLVNLRSFGVYYMAPLAPFDRDGIKDVLGRAPWWIMQKRKNRVWPTQELSKQ